MKKKENWSNDDYIKHYRWQYIVLRILTYLLLIAPITVLICCNFNYYFPLDTKEGQISLGISAVIAIFLLALAIVQVAKHIESKEVTLFFTAFYWLGAAALTYLLARLFADTTLICLCIGGGILLCASCNLLAMNRKRWLDSYIQGTAFARTSRNEEKEAKRLEKQARKEEKKAKKNIASVE